MTYTELKAKSQRYHTESISGRALKAMSGNITQIILDGSQATSPRCLDWLKYLADNRLYDIHCAGEHGVMVRGFIGNKGKSIAIFLKED